MTDFDPNAIQRRFRRAPAGYGEAAFLFERVADSMVGRLDPLTLKPERILDLGAGEGYLTRALARTFPRAALTLQDQAADSLERAAKRAWWRRDHQTLVGDIGEIPLGNDSVDLVASSLALQWLADPDASLREMHRVLRPEGVCLLAVPGPRSFTELRDGWRAIGGRPRVATGIDLHDLGDALARAGMTSIVADSDLLTLEYATLRGLQRDLKSSGSGNPYRARDHGLRGRDYWQRFAKALGNPPYRVTLELVYAHAFKPIIGDNRNTNGEFTVDISSVSRRR